jgi:hypothetical protein
MLTYAEVLRSTAARITSKSKAGPVTQTVSTTLLVVGADHAPGGVHLASTSDTQTLEHPPPVSALVTASRPVSEAVAAAGMLTYAGVC